jgi:hypothetical protein
MVRISLSRSAFPLFDRMLHHSSAPTEIRKAAGRSGGPGRPIGRREAALPWTGASTVACLRRLGTAACIVVRVLSFAIVPVNAAQADNASAGHPASVRPAGSFANLIEEASRRFAVPVHWIRAVMTLESAGDVRARSPKGAMGLMQIMPETWARSAHASSLRRRSLRSARQHPGGRGVPPRAAPPIWLTRFPCAYNAGPGRYEHYLAGRPLPAETRADVAALAPLFGGGEFAGPISVAVGHSRSWTEAPLFIGRPEGASAADRVSAERRSNHVPASDPTRNISALVPQARSLFIVRSSVGDPQ